MKVTIYMPINLYLDCRINRKEIINNTIAEKIKELIYKNGTSLDIKIRQRPHNVLIEPLPIINGYVRCYLENDKEWFHTPEEVRKYLEENWYDYVIEYEVLL